MAAPSWINEVDRELNNNRKAVTIYDDSTTIDKEIYLTNFNGDLLKQSEFNKLERMGKAFSIG